MATNWLKVCKDTPDKPELCLIAEYMKLPREVVFTYWFRVYAWADSLTEDGFIPRVTPSHVAQMTHTPIEFCRLLGAEGVGWMVAMDDTSKKGLGILFRNWQRHNGKCAKHRAMTAERMARKRHVTQEA